MVAGPHPDFDECVVAFVIPSDKTRPPAGADVVDKVKATLANYKVPEQVIILDDFPRIAMGKIQKNELRASLAEAARTHPAH